jgi:type VI secretion system secreted protein Hcp
MAIYRFGSSAGTRDAGRQKAQSLISRAARLGEFLVCNNKQHALRRCTVAAALVSALAMCGPAHATTDMFLKIGDIKGESTDDQHRDEIDVLAFTWGVEGGQLGPSRGATRPCVSGLGVTKYIDRATPALLTAAITGQFLGQAQLTLRRGGGNQVNVLVLTFKDVIVSSGATGGTTDVGQLTETIGLKFTSVQGKYTPLKADGTPDTEVAFSFGAEVCPAT